MAPSTGQDKIGSTRKAGADLAAKDINGLENARDGRIGDVQSYVGAPEGLEPLKVLDHLRQRTLDGVSTPQQALVHRGLVNTLDENREPECPHGGPLTSERFPIVFNCRLSLAKRVEVRGGRMPAIAKTCHPPEHPLSSPAEQLPLPSSQWPHRR